MPENRKEHILLDLKYFSQVSPYEYIGNNFKKQSVQTRNRVNHATELREQTKIITKEMAAAIALQEESKSVLDRGLIVEFESFEGLGEMFEEKSFGRDSELLNIRKDTENDKTYASVFIPDGFLLKFEKMIDAYFKEKKRKDGKSLDNQPLMDTIACFRKATVKALWTDTIPMPDKDTDIFCWEVWLSVRGTRERQLSGFKDLAKSINIETSASHFEFRDRTVLLIRATTKQLEQSLILLI